MVHLQLPILVLFLNKQRRIFYGRRVAAWILEADILSPEHFASSSVIEINGKAAMSQRFSDFSPILVLFHDRG